MTTLDKSFPRLAARARLARVTMVPFPLLAVGAHTRNVAFFTAVKAQAGCVPAAFGQMFRITAGTAAPADVRHADCRFRSRPLSIGRRFVLAGVVANYTVFFPRWPWPWYGYGSLSRIGTSECIRIWICQLSGRSIRCRWFTQVEYAAILSISYP